MNDSAANLTENVKRAALSQKLGYKSCLVTNHRYLVTTHILPIPTKKAIQLEITFMVEFIFLGQFSEHGCLWSLNLKFGPNWCKFHWKRNNLLWTKFIIYWSHVRILLAICESKFPPPWLTSPPALRALRLPQWERPLCLTNVSIKVVYAHQ